MAKRIRVKIGDVFEVNLENDKKGYFQFLTLDITQLNSEVIRVFKTQFGKKHEPNLEEIVKGEIQFFTHLMIKLGLKKELWTRVGNVKLEKGIEFPFFRSSGDYGNPEIKISNDWYIWQVNSEKISVGKLNEKQKAYNIGYVSTVYQIPEMMNTGKTKYFYPSY